MLDGVDLHGKWPQGGGGAAVTFDHYMSEVPLLDHKVAAFALALRWPLPCLSAGLALASRWPCTGLALAFHWPATDFERWQCHESWRNRLAGLRNVTVSLGRPDFMVKHPRSPMTPADLLVYAGSCRLMRASWVFQLMNNEFGLGHPSTYHGAWSRYQKGLAAIEFNMELHIAGFDVACMWVATLSRHFVESPLCLSRHLRVGTLSKTKSSK